MLESFEILYRLIAENAKIDKNLDRLIEKNFYTLCDYTFYLFCNKPKVLSKKEDKSSCTAHVRGKRD
jgi:hypothetical protein